jgi:hypothetical protein
MGTRCIWSCPNMSASGDMPATGGVPSTSYVSAATPVSTASYVSATAPMSTTSYVSATAPMSTTSCVTAAAPMSTASHVTAAAPMSTTSCVTAAAPMSTTSHLTAAASMSTALVVVSEGRNNREAADTDRHSQSGPIPKSGIRAKPLEGQQSLHKEPFTPGPESYNRDRDSPALHKETVRKNYASFQYKESKNRLEKS